MYYVGYPKNNKSGKILPTLKVIFKSEDYDKAKQFFNKIKEEQKGKGWLIYHE